MTRRLAPSRFPVLHPGWLSVAEVLHRERLGAKCENPSNLHRNRSTSTYRPETTLRKDRIRTAARRPALFRLRKEPVGRESSSRRGPFRPLAPTCDPEKGTSREPCGSRPVEHTRLSAPNDFQLRSRLQGELHS